LALPIIHAEVFFIPSSALLSSQINKRRSRSLSRSKNKLINHVTIRILYRKISAILGLQKLINMIGSKLLIFMKQGKGDLKK
jgi:hypothetical protein